jgi:hypothetical protein
MRENGTKVLTEENEGLLLTISEQELEQIVCEMKTDTTPGPDGFSSCLFQEVLAADKAWGTPHCQRLHP